jgi:hypothetical protein
MHKVILVLSMVCNILVRLWTKAMKFVCLFVYYMLFVLFYFCIRAVTLVEQVVFILSGVVFALFVSPFLSFIFQKYRNIIPNVKTLI